ncbi:hypothetical protein chiPu_0029853, partial [Chiloscyllium punctatum]|nr:hypothetical protein [Chiloscyllium punctatum]
MTCRCRGWTPASALRVAKTREVVIGMGGRNRPRRHALRLERPEFCELFEHRSPPLPLSRGRPVRSGGQLRRDHPSTQAKSARSVLLCCGVNSPVEGLLSPELLLPMCLLCWLVVGLVFRGRTPARNECSDNWALRLTQTRVKPNLLSSWEDRDYPPGRIGEPYVRRPSACCHRPAPEARQRPSRDHRRDDRAGQAMRPDRPAIA